MVLVVLEVPASLAHPVLLDSPVALGRLLDPGVLAALWGQESRPGLDFQEVPKDPLDRSLPFAPVR